jgi:hypothetical protein
MQANFLGTPVFYEEINLSSTLVAPVGMNFLTVGNIIMAVFGHLFVTNAIYKGIGPLPEMSPLGRTAYRAVLMVFYCFGLSIVLATIVVLLAASGSGEHLYSRISWAQIWATHWVHCMIWAFGGGCIAEALMPEVVALPFVWFLLSNVIGGWCSTLADQAYLNFYQIFPFNWVIILLRNVLYGSFPNMVRMASGVLIGEWLFFVFMFFFLANRRAQSDMMLRAKELRQGQVIDAKEEYYEGELGGLDDDVELNDHM